jgi:glutamate-5-semialdehyde dehydrogenase
MSDKIDHTTCRAFEALHKAARTARLLPSESKRLALENLAQLLSMSKNEERILRANYEDLERLSPNSPPAFRDRLTLNPGRIAGMIESLKQVAKLPDPVAEVTEQRVLANGLSLKRIRAPLGVILMIFESRPNVALEAFSLAFKSGNVIALRGGSESRSTTEVLYQLMSESLVSQGLQSTLFYGLNNYDRDLVKALLERKDWIDVVVPRGGERLIEFVQTHAQMPIIKNDRGMCHTYIDIDADLDMAVNIVANAKTQRPGVCNALETVLVHDSIASDFIPRLYDATRETGLRWRCDDKSMDLLAGRDCGAHQSDRENTSIRITRAHANDWDTEHLDLIINCRVVTDIDDAIAHIEQHGSCHSEAIVTGNEQRARKFQNEVDAAAVYWNASTRFTDGFEFGLGGELGISTQKIHVRGPVGLRELTTPRWVIDGTGQIR